MTHSAKITSIWPKRSEPFASWDHPSIVKHSWEVLALRFRNAGAGN